MTLDFLLNDAFLDGFKSSSPMEQRATTRFLNRVQDSEESIFNLAGQDPDSVHLNDAKVMDAVISQLTGGESEDTFSDMARRRQAGEELSESDINSLNKFAPILQSEGNDLAGLRTKQLSTLANHNATGATDAELQELGRTKLGLDLTGAVQPDEKIEFAQPVEGYTGEATPLSAETIAIFNDMGAGLDPAIAANTPLDPDVLGGFATTPVAATTIADPFGFQAQPEVPEADISPSLGRNLGDIFGFLQ